LNVEMTGRAGQDWEDVVCGRDIRSLLLVLLFVSSQPLVDDYVDGLVCQFFLLLGMVYSKAAFGSKVQSFFSSHKATFSTDCGRGMMCPARRLLKDA